MKEILILIAELLDHKFIPDCGSDFENHEDCSGCKFYHQCLAETERDKKVKELQQLIKDDMHQY